MSIKYLYLAICAVIASCSEIKNFLSGVEPVSYSEEKKSNGTVIKCFWFNSDFYSVFDLSSLKPTVDDRYSNFTFDNGLILFNICDDIKKDISGCDTETQVLYRIDGATEENKCTKRLSGDASKGSEWSLIDSKNQNGGLKIKMSTGDDSKTVTFHITCKKNLTEFRYLRSEPSSIDAKDFIFYFESVYGCPKADFYFIYKNIMDKPYIFGSALILLGLFELFLGQKLVTATIFIFSTALVVLFVFVFFFQFIIPGGVDQTVFWIVLAIAIIVGLVLGYFVAKYKDKFFGIIMGALLGYIIGQILYNLALNRITSMNQTLLQVIVYVISIGVCIALGILLFNIVTIFATALIGAYAVIRGISIFAGGFPNETTIADLVKRKEMQQLENLLTWKVYLYLAGWALLFIVGLVVQIKIFAADKEEEKNKETTKGDDTSAYYKKFGYKK